MADSARPASQKRPRRRGRSAAGHKTDNEKAPKLDEKDLKVKSDIDTGIDIHDEVVGVEPPGRADDGDAAGADDGLEKGELTSTHGVHAPFLAHEA